MEETGSRWRDPWGWGLALWGALLASAAFPPGPFWLLVLAGPAPLWAGVLRTTPQRAFWRGWLYGLGFFLALVWWIVPTVTRYSNLPFVAGVGCLALLASYLALYPALGALACAAAAARSPAAALALAPLLWTGLEWLRGLALSGFPWGDLPQALWRVPGALRLAPWVGIDGVRLLVAAVATAVAWWGACAAERRRLPWLGLLPALAGAGVAFALAALPEPTAAPAGQLRVGVVQGNIDQAQKWDPAFRRSALRVHGDLTRSLALRGVDLVLWPETAAPFYAQEAGPGRDALSDFARRAGAWLAFGAPAYVEGPEKVEHRNAVFLMAPSGALTGRYDKVHLVPFGEYVPLGRFFPFVTKLVEGVGDFTSGPGALPLAMAPGMPRLGPLVCFEVIFPELASRHMAAGAQVLTVVTNDGWFGSTPGPWQHLAFAAWRAAETGLPLVRAANTGVSAVFDGRGRMLRATDLQTRDAFRLVLDVPAPHRTPQAAVRPWIGPGCLALAGLGLSAILRRPRAAGDVHSRGRSGPPDRRRGK